MRSSCGALLAAALSGAACSRSADSSWVGETSSAGDTTIVHTRSGQLWSTGRHAVVDLSIGSLDVPETSFGLIADVATNNDGDVFVYDWQVPVIRQFNSLGQFVRQIGNAGRGPGEYGKPIAGLAVRSDNRLQLGDLSNRRITLYNPDGTLSDTWAVLPAGTFPNQSMQVGNDDLTYIRVLTGVNSFNVYTSAYIRLRAEGSVSDTVREPELRNPPAGDGLFNARKVSVIGPDGSIAAGVSDKYEFAVYRSDGSVLRVSRSRELVRIPDAEHAALEAWRVYLIGLTERLSQESARGGNSPSGATSVASGPPVVGETPRVKPAFRSLHVTKAGNIWVRLYTEGKLRANYEAPAAGQPPVSPFFEPIVYDVFDKTGKFLGDVSLPDDVTALKIDDDIVWGWRVGESGEPQVVRMRVTEPGNPLRP